MAGPPGLHGGTSVVIDPAKLAAFIREPGGPVLRKAIEDGEKVKQEARRLVGVKTGNLRDHILKRVTEVNGEPVVIVGVDKVPYALWHHEGTVPHPIVARKAPLLVFFSEKHGKLIFTKSVNHPGTKPNRFLVNALRVLH
jgi:acetyl-CoA carboxylase alpha subunit